MSYTQKSKETHATAWKLMMYPATLVAAADGDFSCLERAGLAISPTLAEVFIERISRKKN